MTRTVAEAIARGLSSDIDEVLAETDRDDFEGYALSREEAVQKKVTDIKATGTDPGLYDLTIIGTPIWVQTVSSPVRAYISLNRERFTRVAFFCTQDRSGAQSAFEEMQTLCGRDPLATLEILHADVEDDSYRQKVECFLSQIRNV
jgi:flavodoxin